MGVHVSAVTQRPEPCNTHDIAPSQTAVMKASILLFGLVAFITLGALVLPYLVDAGADVVLAVVQAVTPP
jgi:hypothetical protein